MRKTLATVTLALLASLPMLTACNDSQSNEDKADKYCTEQGYASGSLHDACVRDAKLIYDNGDDPNEILDLG